MMDRLPLEILNNICASLPHSDLKNLRLVSQALQPSAEFTVFHTVYLRYNLRSFDRLRDISNHPRLSKYVKFIDYDFLSFDLNLINTYSPETSFYDWLYEWAGRGLGLPERKRERLLRRFSATRLGEFHISYTKWIVGQKRLSKQRRARWYLDNFLARFPNFSGFRFSLRKHVPSTTTGAPKLENLDVVAQEILAGPDSKFGPLWCSGHLNFGDFFDSACQAGFAPKLRQVYMSDQTLGFWNSQAVSSNCYDEVLPSMETLSLDFPFCPNESHETFHLGAMVTRCPNLRTLHISLGDMPNYSSPNTFWHVVHLSDIFTDTKQHLKHLTTLSLEALVTTQPELQSLLKRHAPSLRSLTLSKIEFRDRDRPDECHGSFLSLVQFMNTSMTLEQAQFNEAFSNHWNEFWKVRPSSTKYKCPNYPNCFKIQIERFAVRKVPCPFSRVGDDNKRGVNPWKFDEDNCWYPLE
ncbi:hypothetical protein G7Y89_g1183 [Cudoniella acicularis]|uniref:F-box domain-containing protein n=1 Tax=Cudoniella acicularis TaxID=354080 RepID=A0A8H4RXS3_9HELO|nr:hypothetical protein G7Y89_g1183 [Cudoniella acicularis]